MFHFNHYSEGYRLVTERPHRLEESVYTYMARWVIRDIHEKRMDTKSRLYREWVDQLKQWQTGERHYEFLMKVVVVLYLASFIALDRLSSYQGISSGGVLVFVLLLLGMVPLWLIFRSRLRQQRIRTILSATREMLEVETNEVSLRRLEEIKISTTCSRLKEYLEHPEQSRLYICQVRGVVEYHQARTLGGGNGQ